MTQDDTAYAIGGAVQPVSSLAKRVVERRLAKVARLLPRAAKHPERNVEYVHDLRVAARRATVALQMFAPCLPGPERERMTAQLRRIRRSAGPARDLDVIEERLSRIAVAGGATPQLAVVIDRIRRKRHRAQKPLRRAHKRARKQGFRVQASSISQQVRWRGEAPEPDVREWAGAALRPLLDRFAARSSADLTDKRALHRMRIAEKRVRYSLDALREAAVPPVDRVSPVLEELQERLGEINDHDAARALLLRWRSGSKDDSLREIFGYLAAFEQWSGSYAHDQFLAWWTPSRRLDLLEKVSELLGDLGHPGHVAAFPYPDMALAFIDAH